MIKFIKLTNGDEMIAEVDDKAVEGDVIEVSNPFLLMMTGDQGAVLVPCPCTSLDLPLANVYYMGDPRDQLKQVYKEATSNIALPPSGLHLPGNNNRMNGIL